MRTRLSRLRPGSRAIVLRTEGDGALSRRLFALGFVPGTEIFCERLSPFDIVIILEYFVDLEKHLGEEKRKLLRSIN